MSNDPWRNARVMYEKKIPAPERWGSNLSKWTMVFAQMSMTVSADMLNGHQTCHGGQLFTLADTAFAYACNSRGLAAVASAANIDFSSSGVCRRQAGRHRKSQTAGQADRRLRHRNC